MPLGAAGSTGGTSAAGAGALTGAIDAVDAIDAGGPIAGCGMLVSSRSEAGIGLTR